MAPGNPALFNPHWRLQVDRFQQEIIRLSNRNPNPSTFECCQFLSHQLGPRCRENVT